MGGDNIVRGQMRRESGENRSVKANYRSNCLNYLLDNFLHFTGYTQAACNPPGQSSQAYQFGDKSGTIYSPYFPNDYVHRLRCYFFIGAADTTQIELTYNVLRMEPKKDFIEIGLGPSVGQNVQREYDVDDTITPLPANEKTVLYQAEKLWIFMFTDFSILNQGFNISYRLGKYRILQRGQIR